MDKEYVFAPLVNLKNESKLLVVVLNVIESKLCRGTDYVTTLTLFDGVNSSTFRLFTEKQLQKIMIGDVLYIENIVTTEKHIIKTNSIEVLKYDEQADESKIQKILNKKIKNEVSNKMRQNTINKNEILQVKTDKKMVHSIINNNKTIQHNNVGDANTNFCELKIMIANHMLYLQKEYLTNITKLRQHTRIVDTKINGYFTFIGTVRNVMLEMKNLTILYMTDFVNDNTTNKKDQFLVIKVWDKYAAVASLLSVGKMYCIKNIKGTLADTDKSKSFVQISDSCKAEFIECNLNMFKKKQIKNTECNINIAEKKECAENNAEIKEHAQHNVDTNENDIYATFRHFNTVKPEIKTFKLKFIHVYDFPIFETNNNKICTCFFDYQCKQYIENTKSEKITCKQMKANDYVNCYNTNNLNVMMALVSDHNDEKNYVYVRSTLLTRFDYRHAIKYENEVICIVLCDKVNQNNIFTIIDLPKKL